MSQEFRLGFGDADQEKAKIKYICSRDAIPTRVRYRGWQFITLKDRGISHRTLRTAVEAFQNTNSWKGSKFRSEFACTYIDLLVDDFSWICM